MKTNLTFIFICISFALAFSQKIESTLLAKSATHSDLECLVIFKDQADVQAANQFQSKEEKGDFVFKTLQQKAKNTQNRVLNFLQAQKIQNTPFYIINAIYVKTSIQNLRKIAEFEEVKVIADNPWTQFEGAVAKGEMSTEGARELEWGIGQINANKVWLLGFQGQGVVIGGQDTGYQWDHPTLRKSYRGSISDTNTNHNYNWYDAIKDKSPLSKDSLNPCGFDIKAPCDDLQHGTHTMGTMVGDDGLGNQIGVAPKARWIACRNMERGNGSPNTYIKSFEWFLAPTDLNGKNPDPKRAPHVINNSWYCSEAEGCNSNAISSMMELAVKNLKASGVVVIISAGNAGSKCSSVSEAPGSFESGFCVGATDINDQIANFSSRGPNVFGNWLVPYIKPNVTAPGVNIRSSVPGNGFGAGWNGTSMAGPHVAGAVALIISANPNLAGKVEMIENILETTAVPLITSDTCGNLKADAVPNFTYGYGRIDVLAAVKKAQNFSTSLSEVPIQNVNIYPNPTSDVLNVIFEKSMNNIEINIYNNAGKNILSQKVSDSKQLSIDIRSLPMSPYYYEIRTEKGFSTGKFIKI